eukprot:scaffold1.g5200.t1
MGAANALHEEPPGEPAAASADAPGLSAIRGPQPATLKPAGALPKPTPRLGLQRPHGPKAQAAVPAAPQRIYRVPAVLPDALPTLESLGVQGGLPPAASLISSLPPAPAEDAAVLPLQHPALGDLSAFARQLEDEVLLRPVEAEGPAGGPATPDGAARILQAIDAQFDDAQTSMARRLAPRLDPPTRKAAPSDQAAAGASRGRPAAALTKPAPRPMQQQGQPATAAAGARQRPTLASTTPSGSSAHAAPVPVLTLEHGGAQAAAPACRSDLAGALHTPAPVDDSRLRQRVVEAQPISLSFLRQVLASVE